jgi:hypothetical protein
MSSHSYWCYGIYLYLLAFSQCCAAASGRRSSSCRFGSYCVCRVSIPCRSLLIIMAVALPMFSPIFLSCLLALSFWGFY